MGYKTTGRHMSDFPTICSNLAEIGRFFFRQTLCVEKTTNWCCHTVVHSNRYPSIIDRAWNNDVGDIVFCIETVAKPGPLRTQPPWRTL